MQRQSPSQKGFPPALLCACRLDGAGALLSHRAVNLHPRVVLDSAWTGAVGWEFVSRSSRPGELGSDPRSILSILIRSSSKAVFCPAAVILRRGSSGIRGVRAQSQTALRGNAKAPAVWFALLQATCITARLSLFVGSLAALLPPFASECRAACRASCCAVRRRPAGRESSGRQWERRERERESEVSSGFFCLIALCLCLFFC